MVMKYKMFNINDNPKCLVMKCERCGFIGHSHDEPIMEVSYTDRKGLEHHPMIYSCPRCKANINHIKMCMKDSNHVRPRTIVGPDGKSVQVLKGKDKFHESMDGERYLARMFIPK